MKTIIISRHAKSSWAHPGLSDFDRPLNDRGHRDAPEMARKIELLGFTPDAVITSPAKRALTTANYYAEHFSTPISEVKKLYHGIPEDYLTVVQGLPKNINTVFLFGHNPGITYLANQIQPGVTDNIPTAGVIIATSPAKDWESVVWENCKLVKIVVPKEISY